MADSREEIRRYLCSAAARGNRILFRCGQTEKDSPAEEEQPVAGREEKKSAPKGKKKSVKLENIEKGIVYNSANPEQDGLFAGKGESAEAPDLSGYGFDELAAKVSGCTLCALSQSRTNTVFGAGDSSAGVVFVGEAPGREEDLSGVPFVGRAGKLLDKILAAIDFSREDVYIANILKCRPPNNRDPNEKEVRLCEPFLQRQLELINPVAICALGRIAAQTLLRTKSPLGKMRGRIHYYNGIKLIATYHPAALLRNPNFKRPAWEDMKMLRAIYDSGTG